ncbi:MAG: hypothetical protein J6Q13_03655 [Clostridia bacterium]|nr:hypothetical protein [Clostridia bacterium]
MSLQSIENWCLYYAMKGNADMLKLYRCVNKLNENIKKQAELDKVQTNDNDLIL